ncbi:unnamed protein product [Rotaria sordida]|uniref:Uncharacterized protein n=2 Tax=Rotaria sordida TaxID=392033 RepID=A0A814FRV3_9BILA|nr:unnamed protein product [Rotaria sordida]
MLKTTSTIGVTSARRERGERGKLTGFQLWQSGGVSAMNNALQRANQHHNICRTNCNIYFANLDDDDTWSPDHLSEHLSIFTRFPSVVFIWSKGYYCGAGGSPFPPTLVPQDKVNNWPAGFGGSILHSSWSWKMEIFRGFRYRAQWDYPANYNGPREADADLFEVKLNMVDVLYSLVGISKRLDQLLLDPLYIRNLDMISITMKSFNDRIYSLNNEVLLRICKNILPRFHHQVNELIIEQHLMERLLHTINYSQLFIFILASTLRKSLYIN